MQSSKSANFEKSSSITTNMECEDEELSPAQIAHYSRAENDYQTLWTSLQKKLRLKGFTEIPEPLILTKPPKFVPGLGFQIDSSSIQKSSNTPGQPMPPTITSQPLKVITSQGNRAQSPLNTIVSSQNTISKPRSNTAPMPTSTIVPVGSRPLSQALGRAQPSTQSLMRPRGALQRVILPPTSTVTSTTQSSAPKQQTSNLPSLKEGGSAVKSTEKTFPSLIVLARPTLQVKKMTAEQMAAACQERAAVDGRVKQVLLHTATKFTEWLIQQGLLKREQFCSTHLDDELKPVKLQLGVYSDPSKYQNSGGYVWLSECCPQKSKSVFTGSIFEDAPFPPNIILKLIYHWACQTSIMNIVAWVKVSSLFIKTFFTSLRAVCTTAVHEKYEKLGGENVKVEVGVISLGTTASDGGGRQVKIEVLGMMETESKLMRLQAIEPTPGLDKNSKKKFKTVLESMEHLVHKNSIIYTDFTIDKSTLQSMGFKNIIQSSNIDPNKKVLKDSNINIMEYLKKAVPKMFQNTLAYLSRQMIQQFLDELVWRERWGYISAKAFDALIEDLAEQTKLTTGYSLVSTLQRIALNPFKDWKYSNWKINCDSCEPMDVSELESSSSKLPKINEDSTSRFGRKRHASDLPALVKSPSIDLAKRSDLMALDSFYYGMLPASKVVEEGGDALLKIKCVICSYDCNDIISFMKHLISHAFHESSEDKDPMCRYCLRTFATDYWLQSHLSETHMNETGFKCCICEEKFKDRTSLILHMHRCHVELELPYKCQICDFRTSKYTDVVDHFYDAHRKGETLVCPFCLKTVALAANGKTISQNQYFFLNHIQKHKRKAVAKKCSKCVLWFVQKGLLLAHENSDHSSCKDVENVQRFAAPVDCAMMPKPKPKLTPQPSTSHKLTKDILLENSLFSKSTDLKSIQLTIPEESLVCSECESSLNEEGHFPAEFNCKKCKFVTNCYNAIVDHVTVLHDLRYAREPAGSKQVSTKPFKKDTQLKNSMHCCCGFESSSGNKLACHLLSCKKKSAYPSRVIAKQNALRRSAPDLDDEDYDPDDPDDPGDPEDENIAPNSSFELRSIRRGRS
ncbi:uncharacterized protein LOC111062200 isoform X1 [Nilaparvata lugens]|uniref:uncharacterized protein LOC111062200 isoform X1 n=1 Tax=Nilaparvata lugens TaxID=108931 RepID=UPI00193E881F|nr:uncharacterized protein LOC111062200 isoform X1 [Nilaparvata lugens]XP_039278373.1 uncharacterized protein LOC111062200 isoform X1 [Nilaparvata lugens]XP_039278381.1 uncharacterized protein LOC111062200 isoform X1 [Nilaparvata lugens]XP_039278387.1 uncharacterized protein LOC111062200 isoform X1 [Nilaparvata lugens]